MLDAPLLLLTLTLAAPPSAGSFEATRARALKAFKARDYKSACELYERAAKLNPTHALVHSDLGLCLARLGQKEQAARENARAVFLARPEPGLPESGEEGTRKAAYYNLFSLGERLEVPEPGKCAPLRRAPGCDQPVYACGASFEDSGSGGGTRGTAVSLSLSPEGAESGIKDGEFYKSGSPSEARVDSGLIINFGSIERYDLRRVPAQAELAACLVMVHDEEVMFGGCEAHARWDCGRSREVSAMSKVCLKARGPCDAGTSEACEEECHQQACTRAEREPSPEVLEELKDADTSLEGCAERASHLRQTECVTVLADACSGVVGVVCESREQNPNSKSKPERRIGELHLARPEP